MQWNFDLNKAPKDGTQVDLWVKFPSSKSFRLTDCRWQNDENHWPPVYNWCYNMPNEYKSWEYEWNNIYTVWPDIIVLAWLKIESPVE